MDGVGSGATKDCFGACWDWTSEPETPPLFTISAPEVGLSAPGAKVPLAALLTPLTALAAFGAFIAVCISTLAT